ncbi:hypothetical protein [Brachybacterium huguangmaarense]
MERTAAPNPAAPAAPDRRRALAAGLLAIEVLGLLVVASLFLLDGMGSTQNRRFALGLAAFLALFAVILGSACASLLRGTRFGVGYGVTWQFFQALVGASMLRNGLYVPGVLALVTAIAAFVVLLRIAQRAPAPAPRD